MARLAISVFIYFILFPGLAFPQVKVRLFANRLPESVIFSVLKGEYIITMPGVQIKLAENEPVVIMKLEGRLAVKGRNNPGFMADSVLIKGTGDASFSLRINGSAPVRQAYKGNLHCHADLETLLLINYCDIEDYIAGVVQAEGGTGKNREYFKTQAVLARTYVYRHFDKHSQDNFNVCDNTHCQAYNGVSSDSQIIAATTETKGLVVTDSDNSLIISAFHSNCGGETSSSEDVWLTDQKYLKKVIDPYCVSTRNASWEKKISMGEWLAVIKKYGYTGLSNDPSIFRFIQKSRMSHYYAGSFTLPLSTLRNELNLRSTFFSVIPGNDFLILRGKGYGHGVGLCQEGAMVMASKGIDFREIIAFYYSNVKIQDIGNAILLPSPAETSLMIVN